MGPVSDIALSIWQFPTSQLRLCGSKSSPPPHCRSHLNRIRHPPGPTDQALILARDGPGLANARILQVACKWGQKCSITRRHNDWEDDRLPSRMAGRVSTWGHQKSRARRIDFTGDALARRRRGITGRNFAYSDNPYRPV